MPNLKLYLGENYPTELAVQLRRRGIDVITAREAGNLGLSDDGHLVFAASQGYVLLSFDQDYVGIWKAWFREGKSHSGIVLSQEYKEDAFSILFQLCLNMIEWETPASLANLLCRLEQYR